MCINLSYPTSLQTRVTGDKKSLGDNFNITASIAQEYFPNIIAAQNQFQY